MKTGRSVFARARIFKNKLNMNCWQWNRKSGVIIGKSCLAMNICILAPDFLPIWGGVSSYTVELVRHLPNDIKVHVVAPMREGIDKEKVSTADCDFSEYFGDNVHLHFVCKARDTFVYNATFQLACLKNLPEIIKKEDINLVHYGSQVAELLLRFKKIEIPTVTTIHTTIRGQRDGAKVSGVGFWDLEFSEKATYLTYPFLRLAEIIYFSKVRYYITVSNWMKQQLQKQYPKMNHSSISVIHNSVDTKLFSPSAKRNRLERDLVLITGRLTATKGIRYLVEAVPKILEEYPEASFVCIGPGNSMPYKRRLKKMGIPENKFAFLGYLKERSELIKYYRASSVFLVPSLYENLPIRMLEAMACGVPVVASNICAISEAIDNGVNGILIPPGSVNELANAVCSLLSDSNLRRKMGDNARKTTLEKFDWSVNAIRTAEVYQRILDKF